MRFSSSLRTRMPHPGRRVHGQVFKGPSKWVLLLLLYICIQNCQCVSPTATSWVHKGNAFARGFVHTLLDALCWICLFLLVLACTLQISICSPGSMRGALWGSHPFTKAFRVAIAKPVVAFSIKQLIYSAKYTTNMQSWLCTSISS